MIGCAGCAAAPADDALDVLASHEEGPKPAPGSVRLDTAHTECGATGLWTTSVAQAPDGSRTFTFSTPNTYTGIMTPESDQLTVGCTASLQLGIPPGESWALMRVEVQGTASLAIYGQGTLAVSHDYPRASDAQRPFGEGETRRASVEVRGPHEGLIAVASDVPAATLSWLPCGEPRSAAIYASGALKQGSPRAHGTFSFGVDGATTLRVRYAVRKCGADAGAAATP